MARYRLVWLELAEATRDTLPAPARGELDARLEQLLEDPRARDRGGYDPVSDSFATTYGNGLGLLTYALVHDRETLIVLRVVQRPSTPRQGNAYASAPRSGTAPVADDVDVGGGRTPPPGAGPTGLRRSLPDLLDTFRGCAC